MPTYAILGATGSAGTACTRTLIGNPPTGLSLKIYVRSKKKLLALLPALNEDTRVVIVEGALSDQEALATCIKGADAIFSCIASKWSEPDMDIAAVTAAQVISCLQHIRKSGEASSYITPVLVMLSSASVNKVLSKQPHSTFIKFVKTALAYLYDDLRQAEKLYLDVLASDPGLLKPIFLQPGGIMPGETSTGYRFSTEEDCEAIYFADVGDSMVELANRQEFVGMGVIPVATGVVVQDWSENAKSLIWGLFAYLLPNLYKTGMRRGWW